MPTKLPRRDQRSPEAKAYRHLYKTKGWQTRRANQLAKQPLCERHLKRGRIVPATVANHKIPHKGDAELFYRGELESLCASCHDGDVQSEERTGYSKAIGDDGWPIDPAHPANRTLAKT